MPAAGVPQGIHYTDGAFADTQDGGRSFGVEEKRVSLVIPGLNCSRTIRQCLTAALSVLHEGRSGLEEIIFVDDGSTDDTARIVAEYPVRYLSGRKGGPGSARNVGWRAAQSDLIWFVDSDCVARPDALACLVPHLEDPTVAGGGGSYDNLCPHSLLALMIHEEIIQRHLAMGPEVDFLAGFNVLYRRRVLEEAGGFDEHLFNGPGRPGAEEAELAYRIHAAGHLLRFEPRSKVGHYHPTVLRRYLRSQRIHGYFRVNLHLRHPHTGAGDTYSSIVDHVQPPLALLSLPAAALAFLPAWRFLAVVPLVLLLLAQIPLAAKLCRRLRQVRYLAFVPLGFIRAYWRGIGMAHAIFAQLVRHLRGQRYQ